jgi:hypothetical protein
MKSHYERTKSLARPVAPCLGQARGREEVAAHCLSPAHARLVRHPHHSPGTVARTDTEPQGHRAGLMLRLVFLMPLTSSLVLQPVHGTPGLPHVAAGLALLHLARGHRPHAHAAVWPQRLVRGAPARNRHLRRLCLLRYTWRPRPQPAVARPRSPLSVHAPLRHAPMRHALDTISRHDLSTRSPCTRTAGRVGPAGCGPQALHPDPRRAARGWSPQPRPLLLRQRRMVFATLRRRHGAGDHVRDAALCRARAHPHPGVDGPQPRGGGAHAGRQRLAGAEWGLPWRLASKELMSLVAVGQKGKGPARSVVVIVMRECWAWLPQRRSPIGAPCGAAVLVCASSAPPLAQQAMWCLPGLSCCTAPGKAWTRSYEHACARRSYRGPATHCPHDAGLLERDAAQHPLGPSLRRHPVQCAGDGRVRRRVGHLR